MATVTICSDFVAQENKCLTISTVSTLSPSIFHEMVGPDAMIFVLLMLSFKPTFSTLLFHFHQEALELFFASCHKGGVICISEVMDLTFQVPMQYCSLQHRTLLLSPVTSTTGCCFHFGSVSSFFLELFLH